MCTTAQVHLKANSASSSVFWCLSLLLSDRVCAAAFRKRLQPTKFLATNDSLHSTLLAASQPGIQRREPATVRARPLARER